MFLRRRTEAARWVLLAEMSLSAGSSYSTLCYGEWSSFESRVTGVCVESYRDLRLEWPGSVTVFWPDGSAVLPGGRCFCALRDQSSPARRQPSRSRGTHWSSAAGQTHTHIHTCLFHHTNV